MCGIVGQVALRADGTVDVAEVRGMTRALTHRGPDGDGVYVAPGGRAALGHRRLSIIDLVTGAQPIYNEDGTIAVVLNGEVYNFQALRARLEAAGHRFSTSSDTEAIVHLYEEHGVDCVRHLRGMFALILWDARRGRLLAARDRVGKKPLYYAEHGGRLSLASEITALYRLRDLPRALDPEALDLYLTHSYVPSPRTVLAGVRKLPPAHALVVERGAVRLDRYWTPPTATAEATDSEATAALTRRLEEAVRLRMIADVPLGCFLSGGVDSSIVVALMSRLSSEPVRTFSIGFDHDAYDELGYARTVARRFGTEHEEFVVKADAAAVLPDLTEHFGEPFGDSSALPVWYLSQLARTRVTVALNGDGGDELFAGYPWYANGARLAAAAAWVPSLATRTWRGPLGRRLRRALPRIAAKGADLVTLDAPARFAALRRTLDARGRAGLYARPFAARVGGAALAYLEDAYPRAADDLVRAMAVTDVTTYLPEDLLVKVDRMTMAHALEGRSPFLDAEVVELALAWPARLKRDARGGKRILKRAFGPLFPPGFLDRPKMGFSAPVDEWLRGELGWLLRARLFGGVFAEAAIVDPGAVRALLAEHDAGRSHGATLWNLLMLAEWFERFGAGGRWAPVTRKGPES